MAFAEFDDRPIIVAIAGPNGAGKSTFYDAFVRDAGLRFINADDIGRQLGIDPYDAAAMANALREELARQRESFVFETVLSDPVGNKVAFLENAAASGYNVVLCFVGIPNATVSDERVAMRVSQGGHDVPAAKLKARFARTLKNLKAAMRSLPVVLIFDNSDLSSPYRRIAEYRKGKQTFGGKRSPALGEKR